MKEELIQFETAKLARNKGYDEKSIYFFREDTKLFSFFGCPTCNSNPGNTSDFVCSAPTQSLLQKWLREVHNIHIKIHHFTEQPMDDEIWKDCYQVFINDIAKHPYTKTYEKALEKGLFEALKLIK